MSERKPERTYSDAEIAARLEHELPHWTLAGGYIVRRYRTAGWKATLMVVNAVGHLAEAAWHHPDLRVSYAWVEVALLTHSAKGITDKDFALAGRSRRSSPGSRERKAARLKERRPIRASPT